MRKQHVVIVWLWLAILFLGLDKSLAATGTIQDVKHVIILMQENRSFDHYFGTMQGVRGYNDPNVLVYPNGASDLFQYYNWNSNWCLPFPTTNLCINDVDHNEDSGLVAWNNGWWNGWFPAKGPEGMAYYTRTNLSYYYSLADAYTICDDNFCSYYGATFPNRIYLFSGTIDPNGTGGGPVVDDGIPTNGLGWTTYPERLQAAGVNWKVYRPNGDWFGDALQWFRQYRNATPGNPLYDRGVAQVSDVVAAFKADVTNGTLPQVSWIIPPDLTWSEHPPYSIGRGEWFVNQILATLQSNPSLYNSTALIINYDENGGFYDHMPPPVPPPGTTNEYIGTTRLGLGIRVPMIIVSPWTRGGKVCSQVFDHTSVIRFIETLTGVQEPNISAWRRQTCGDLTSAFNFTNPDYTIPTLPATSTQNGTAITAMPPVVQNIPLQEPGVKPACPLPYQPDMSYFTDCSSNRLVVTMTNAGTASVHFMIFPNGYRTDGPWQYDALPGSSVSDSYIQPHSSFGLYDFTCYGPNGFQRRLAGNIHIDCGQYEIASQIDPVGDAITLTFQNASGLPVSYTVVDNLNSGNTQTFNLSPNSSSNSVFLVQSNNSWYDLTVTTSGDTNYLRHLAGHIETGAYSFTQIPAVVGNVLFSLTNGMVYPGLTNNATGSPVTTNTTTTVITSITNVVNALISQYALSTASTNSLALTMGAFGTNCALIYPGWASNYVVETTTSLTPPAWTTVPISATTISNCNVVIMPEATPGAYFRLRH